MGLSDQIIDGARDFACGLYRLQPGALIPNPVEAGLRFAWDKLCGEPPKSPNDLPLPPASPFQGGQCACVLYRMNVRFGITSDPSYVGLNEFVGLGPIGGLRTRVEGRREIIEVSCRGRASEGCLPEMVWREAYSQGNYPSVKFTDLGIQDLQRIDGKSDNCGNPPPVYPPAAPPPPGGFISPPVTINYNDGTDLNVTFRLTPPLPPGFGKGPPPIVVEIDNPSFKFPVTFDFGGGVDIGDGIGDLGDKLDDFKNEFDDFKEDWDFNFNPPDFNDDPDIDKDDKEADKDGEEDDIEGLVGIGLSLTKPSSDVQYGTPPIYFAGWLTFKLQGGYVERIPVNFGEGYFPAPLGATGYGYTLTKGAEGAIRVYRKQVKEAG